MEPVGLSGYLSNSGEFKIEEKFKSNLQSLEKISGLLQRGESSEGLKLYNELPTYIRNPIANLQIALEETSLPAVIELFNSLDPAKRIEIVKIEFDEQQRSNPVQKNAVETKIESKDLSGSEEDSSFEAFGDLANKDLANDIATLNDILRKISNNDDHKAETMFKEMPCFLQEEIYNCIDYCEGNYFIDYSCTFPEKLDKGISRFLSVLNFDSEEQLKLKLIDLYAKKREEEKEECHGQLRNILEYLNRSEVCKQEKGMNKFEELKKPSFIKEILDDIEENIAHLEGDHTQEEKDIIRTRTLITHYLSIND